ncbi:GNAT family N-acetyltransferase [Streptomyces sp. DSM 44917]|uniref:GNAT family N-acetyltransferase n=1 Tax=Streptomyces boetiae TaxID=3075541 RepID=A0ABU2L6A6_9ACTN|nr:GNAT family N-acetyltransferase [Streptomyces sp. DSM 44917]MDT0307074.1 GNAT family N-acetyltransferase [Streptomyces sp. DSM 44917]
MTLRPARREEVPGIVAMPADDALGATRENPAELGPCPAAFQRIDADPRQHLLVGECAGRVVGSLQLSIPHGLSRQDCALVRLTSDNARADAHRFYQRLGFRATHVGFELPLA